MIGGYLAHSHPGTDSAVQQRLTPVMRMAGLGYRQVAPRLRNRGRQRACEAISLRRHYPDQVLGVAFWASQPSVNPLLQQGHDLSSLAVSQAHLHSRAAGPRVAGPKVPGTQAFGPTASTAEGHGVESGTGEPREGLAWPGRRAQAHRSEFPGVLADNAVDVR